VVNYNAVVLTQVVTQPPWEVTLPHICLIQTFSGVIIHIFLWSNPSLKVVKPLCGFNFTLIHVLFPPFKTLRCNLTQSVYCILVSLHRYYAPGKHCRTRVPTSMTSFLLNISRLCILNKISASFTVVIFFYSSFILHYMGKINNKTASVRWGQVPYAARLLPLMPLTWQ